MFLNIPDSEKRDYLLANGWSVIYRSGKTIFVKDGVEYTIDAAFTKLIRELLATHLLCIQSVNNTIGVSTLGHTLGTTGMVTGSQIQYVFAGGDNITLSQSLSGSSATVTVIGGSGVSGFDSANILAAGSQTANTTGTVLFSNANGISFGMSNSSRITAQHNAYSASSQLTSKFLTTAPDLTHSHGDISSVSITGSLIKYTSSSNGLTFGMPKWLTNASGSGVGSYNIISAGSQTATSAGTVAFSDSNGVSFGMSGNTRVTAKVDAVRDWYLTGANTLGTTSGAFSNSLFLSGGSNVTLSGNDSTIEIRGKEWINATAGGNTSGTLALVSSGTLTIAGGNNITLSQEGNAITISAANIASAGDGFNRISAGTQIGATNTTIVFSNTNGISFGMSGSSMVSASHNAVTEYQLVGANTAGESSWELTAGRIYLSGGNNITLSGEGSTIKISGSNVDGYNPIIAGSQTVQSTGSLIFSNSNGISFGMSDSSVITAQHNAFFESSQLTDTFITTAALSDHSHGNISTVSTAGSDLAYTSTSSGLTLGIPKWITSASMSGGFNVTITGNTSGTVTEISSGTLTLWGGNNITLSQSGNNLEIIGANTQDAIHTSQSSLFQHTSATSGITASAMNTSERNNYFYTSNNTFANSTHSHGDISLSLLNLSGTYSSLSNGLTLSFTGSTHDHPFINTSDSSLFQHTSATSAITASAVNTSNSSLFQHTSATSAITSNALNTSQSSLFQHTSATSAITASAMNTSERTNYFYTSANTFANNTHTHGNISLSLDGLSGTYASASSGLTFSLTNSTHAHDYIPTGSSTRSAGINTSISSGYAGSTLAFSANSSGITLSVPAWITTAATAGGHNVTLSGNTTGTMAEISSGTWTLAGGTNITLSQSGNHVTIVGPSYGSIYFNDGSGVTFGASTSSNSTTLTASVLGLNNITLSGNTSGTLALITSGSLTLAGGNNITLSQVGNAVTISGGSVGGNASWELEGTKTAGTTGTAFSTLFLEAYNNITLSGNSNSIRFSVGNYVDASESGSVYFQNSNGLTWGSTTGASSTSITGDYAAAKNIVASGNTSGTMATISSGTMTLAGGSNITLSQNGNAITFIGGGGTGGGAALKGSGTYTQNSGTIEFANSNSITFGLTANQMTASVARGNVYFQDSGVSWSSSVNGLSTSLTGNVKTIEGSVYINDVSFSYGDANYFIIGDSPNWVTNTFHSRVNFSMNNTSIVNFIGSQSYISNSTAVTRKDYAFYADLSTLYLQQGKTLFDRTDFNNSTFTMMRVGLDAEKGLLYATDYSSYSSSHTTNDYWIPNRKYVDEKATGAAESNYVYLYGNTSNSSTISGSTISLSGGDNITLGISGGSIQIKGGGGAGGALSGSNTSQSLGTITFGSSNNMHFYFTNSSLVGSFSESTHAHSFVNQINGSSGSISFNTASSLSSSANASGITFGLASNISTAWSGQTTANQSRVLDFNGSSGQISFVTGSGMSTTTNASTLTFGLRSDISTAWSGQTTANASRVIQINGSSGSFSFATGSSLSSSANASGITFGLASNITTTLAVVSHTHGNISIGKTNISVSATTSSNGLSMDFSVAAPGAAAESNWITLGGNVAGNSSVSGSTINWVGGNNITLSGTNGSQVTIIGGAGAGESNYIYLYGNTSNLSSTSGSTISLSAGNNITLAQSGGSIKIEAAAGAGAAISAAGSSQNAGTVVFSNSNSVSFGMNGSTVTASVGRGNVYFQDGFGIAWSSSVDSLSTSISGSYAITGTTATSTGGTDLKITMNTAGLSLGIPAWITTAGVGGGVALYDGANSISSGTARFSNANGITFGFNGQTITGSIATSLSVVNFSAGTTSNNLGSVVFSNSNGISFGLNGSTITASREAVQTVSQYYNCGLVASSTINNPQNSLFIFPLTLFSAVSVSTLIPAVISLSGTITSAATAQAGITLEAALYSQNGASTSRFDTLWSDGISLTFWNSGTSSYSYAISNSAAQTTGSSAGSNLGTRSVMGMRIFSMYPNQIFNTGQYLYGFRMSTSSAGYSAAMSRRALLVDNPSPVGMGTIGDSTYVSIGLSTGLYSVTTGAIPVSLGLSELMVNSNVIPYFKMGAV
jgi:hypothetical protein